VGLVLVGVWTSLNKTIVAVGGLSCHEATMLWFLVSCLESSFFERVFNALTVEYLSSSFVFGLKSARYNYIVGVGAYPVYQTKGES